MLRAFPFRRFKDLGNAAFVKGLDWKALELYNEAVAHAPTTATAKNKARYSFLPHPPTRHKSGFAFLLHEGLLKI